VPPQPRTLASLNRLIAASEPPFDGSPRAVPGEGPLGAAIAFVGEQPGDQEDKEGRPFVGPAGKLLTQMLEQAGMARDAVYLTNAVKHFKFEQRGKRRLHKRPLAGEIEHYRWWLNLELDLVGPSVVVALGATAVRALVGKALPIAAHRGATTFGARAGYITVHPSMLLRIPDRESRRRERALFVGDLRRIRALAESTASGPPRSAHRRSRAHAPPPGG
jgi:DNA polymerase